MSTRILRDANGYPIRDASGAVIRTKPHMCGKNCSLHKEGEGQ